MGTMTLADYERAIDTAIDLRDGAPLEDGTVLHDEYERIVDCLLQGLQLTAAYSRQTIAIMDRLRKAAQN